jgi:hypothetical protein
VVVQQDPRFLNQLELAVRFGKLLVGHLAARHAPHVLDGALQFASQIVQEVDGILPLLYPLLRKDLVR